MQIGRRLLTTAALALSAALALPAAAKAAEVKLGAMPLGSIWYVFAASFAKVITPGLPAGSNVEVIARRGGIGNPVIVNDGKADIALSNVATSAWAFEGEAEIYKGKKHPNIRSLLGGLNEVWIVGMLTEDYIKRTGNDTLEKALLSDKPPRVIMKPAGSSVPPAARWVLEGIGTSFDSLKSRGGSLTQVDVSQIPTLMRDGRADLYFESASPGHPATTEVTLTTPVRFVDLPDRSLTLLAKNGLKILPMPEFFKGQTGPTKAVDLGTHLIANKDLPDDVAYRITKAILEKRDELVNEHKAMSGFKAEDAWKPENNGIPLHPGAIRYYRERGWMKAS